VHVFIFVLSHMIAQAEIIAPEQEAKYLLQVSEPEDHHHLG